MTQNIIVLTIVFLSAAYSVWSLIKTLRIKSTGSCGDDCACSAKTDIQRALLKKQKEFQSKRLEVIR